MKANRKTKAQRSSGRLKASGDIARDTADRKHAEEALRENESKLRGIVEHSTDGIILADERGNIVEWNQSQERITGLKRAEVVGQPVWQVLFQALPEEQKIPAVYEHFRASTLEFLRTGQAPWLHQFQETETQRPDGTRRSVQALTFPIKTDKGFMCGSVTRDVTERRRTEEQIAYQAQLLAVINDAVVASDAQYRLTAWNAAAESMYGWKAEEVLGRVGLDVTHTEFPGVDEAEMLRAIAECDSWRGEATQARKDGTRFPVEVSSVVLRDATGKVTGFVSVNRDISERKRAEEEIAHLTKFPAENPAPVLQLSRDGIVIYANAASDALLDMWNCAVGSYAPQSWRDLIAQALASGQNNSVDVECAQKVYSFFVAPVAEAGYVNFYGRDITTRKRAEEERERLFQEVQRAREELQVLSRRLVEVQETERRFIARELHDEVGQVLTGLKILLETSSHLPADTLRSRLSNAQSLVEQLMEQVQGLSLDLRPTMLDDLGLLPALLWFTKRFADQTGIRVNLEHAGLDRRFAPEIETAAYRIMQEALTNVARHASVKEATARLWATLDTLHVQVEDRGQGFHVETARAAPSSSGLSGMRERAVALGGNLMIESTLGVGTHVTLQVPLSGALERRMKER